MFSFLPTTQQQVTQALALMRREGALVLLFPFVRLFHNQTTKFVDIICTRQHRERTINDSTKISNIFVLG